MATTTDRDTGKRARVPLRMTEDQKVLLQRAATIEGTSLSDFVTRSAEDAARRTMREHEVMTLTARDSVAFVKSLLDPPAPNDALARAFQRHAELVGDE